MLRIEADQPQWSLVTRTERWRARVEARFGEGTLDWLLERGPDGRPRRWCAAVDDENAGGWPDFLWQDLPDVGSKGREAGAWIVNEAMLSRGLVSVRPGATPADPPFVADDHIKHAYELLFCALGGYPYTLLVGNRRYGFRHKAAWQQAVEQLPPPPMLV